MSAPLPSPRNSVSRRPRRRKRGPLFVITCLLVGSAALRIGADASQAFARETRHDVTQAETSALAQPVAPAGCVVQEDLAATLESLQKRDSALLAQEEAMADRLQALKIAEAEVRRQIAELRQAEESLSATLALADSAAENDLSKLTAMYESMKPKDAAALFETMDPQFSAGFLGRMSPEAAAGILSGLSPESAYTISVILAGRNADVPTE